MTTNTNKHIATRKLATGKTVQVTVEQGTWIEKKYWDGYDNGTETHVVNRTEIALLDEKGKILTTDTEIRPLSSGKIVYASQYKQAVETGCVGMIGRAWIKQDTADAVAEALAEALAFAPKTAEQSAIETAETNHRIAQQTWRNSPEGKKSASEQMAYDKFVREMNRADSDY